MSDLSPIALEEYRALRATIRQRGTLRLIVIAITFFGWAALAVSVTALLVVPILGLIPLTVLAAGFEVVFAAHVGVERVGRYLQVHYERPGALPGWEHAAMWLGAQARRRSGIDPLASGLFTVAALLNLVPIALLSLAEGPTVGGVVPLELAVYGALHVVFIGRIVHARRYADSQRQRDLALFEQTRNGPTTSK